MTLSVSPGSRSHRTILVCSAVSFIIGHFGINQITVYTDHAIFIKNSVEYNYKSVHSALDPVLLGICMPEYR